MAFSDQFIMKSAVMNSELHTINNCTSIAPYSGGGGGVLKYFYLDVWAGVSATTIVQSQINEDF